VPPSGSTRSEPRPRETHNDLGGSPGPGHAVRITRLWFRITRLWFNQRPAYHLGAMGVADTGVGLLEKLRLSVLMPRLEIGVEGSARLCTDDHVPIYVAGVEHDPIALHIDVSLELWTKGRDRVAILEERGGRAAGQALREGTEIGSGLFRPITLEPGAPKVENWFSLMPLEGGALQAAQGDRVEFRLRLGRNGRDRHVDLEIGPA
jgi:hypothetical protein